MAHVQSARAPLTIELFTKFASNAVRHLLAAIESANMRHAERKIARFLGPNTKLSDETERRIERLPRERRC